MVQILVDQGAEVDVEGEHIGGAGFSVRVPRIVI
jgi:hypothetical protein